MMNISPEIAKGAVGGTEFLLRIMPAFMAGVYAAQVLERMGWFSGLGRLAAPLMRLGRLSPDCGPGFITSLVSPAAGHAILADLRASGRLGRKELAVAAVLNNLPGEVAAGKNILLLAVPLLGRFGAAYYGVLLIASTLKAALLLLAGRLFLPSREMTHSGHATAPCPGFKEAVRASLKPSLRTIMKVLRTMVPAAYMIYFLIAAGFFDKTAGPLSFLAGYLPLNPAMLPVVAARLISPAGAYTIAGGLFSSGAAAGWELVFALFAGTFIATATSLRYTIPYYCGIFGGPDGTVIIAVSMAARIMAYGAVLAGLGILIS